MAYTVPDGDQVNFIFTIYGEEQNSKVYNISLSNIRKVIGVSTSNISQIIPKLLTYLAPNGDEVDFSF